MKKCRKKGAIKIFCSVVSGIILLASVENASAADYVITIKDGALSKNQTIIFEEQNIGPGFASKDYPIIVRNESELGAKVQLINIQPDLHDANDLLPGVSIWFADSSKKTVIDGRLDNLGNIEALKIETGCIKPGGEEAVFYTGFIFDKAWGNEFQNTSFWLIYTFLIEGDMDCDADIGGELLPPTGESSRILLMLASVSVVGLISVFFFLGLVMARKKAEEKT